MHLDVHHMLTLLYGAMGLVALAGYGPQVRALWTKPDLCEKTPLVTWMLWSAQTVVFFLYALIANGDLMFVCNSFMFMCATLGCLALIVRGRRLAEAHRKALPQNVVRLVA